MAPSLVIRPAVPADMDALQDLYGHLSPDAARCPPDLALRNLNAIAAYDGSAVLVGMTDGALVTSCTLIVIPNLTRGGAPYGLIENVVTETAQRGQGFGRAILDAASDRAWDHGCYKIMLSTGSAKPETLAFYEAAGFEQSRTGFQKRKLPRRAE